MIADGCHPTDAGYAVYEEALEAFAARARAAAEKKPAGKPKPLPKPLTPRPMDQAKLVPRDAAKADANWKAGDKSPGWKFGTVLA